MGRGQVDRWVGVRYIKRTRSRVRESTKFPSFLIGFDESVDDGRTRAPHCYPTLAGSHRASRVPPAGPPCVLERTLWRTLVHDVRRAARRLFTARPTRCVPHVWTCTRKRAATRFFSALTDSSFYRAGRCCALAARATSAVKNHGLTH